MCGFFGYVDFKGDISSLSAKIRRCSESISNRGPDDSGEYFDKYFGVIFYRLSILDLSPAGHQPAISPDGSLVMVFNGAIYNHQEIRQKLKILGYKIEGCGDTQILLFSYIEWGERCVDHLKGMYSFAVWDHNRRILRLFRDHMGIKPLYFYYNKSGCAFSSTITSLTHFQNNGVELNERAVFKYLARGWLDDSCETFYKNILKVEPGTYIEISDAGLKIVKYWSLPTLGEKKFDKEEFLSSLQDNIEQHLISDVPIAATLSGGLDSSTIVSIALNKLKNSDQLSLFSILPPNTIDESEWISKVVKKFGAKHQFISLHLNEMRAILLKVLLSQEEPFHSSSCIYQYLLRKKISEYGVKVLLVGEGGDEVLGGYRRLLLPYLYDMKKNGLKFDNELKGAQSFYGASKDEIEKQVKYYGEILHSNSSGQENLTPYLILNKEFINKHLDISIEPSFPIFLKNGESEQFYLHLKDHLIKRDVPYVLRMEDKSSMAFGIESRVPFLDKHFIEMTFRHKFSEFMKDGENKSMLRRAMHGILPNEILERKSKSPRPGNDAHFIYDLMASEALECFHDEDTSGSKWFNKGMASQFKKDLERYNHESAGAWLRAFLFINWRVLNGVN